MSSKIQWSPSLRFYCQCHCEKNYHNHNWWKMCWDKCCPITAACYPALWSAHTNFYWVSISNVYTTHVLILDVSVSRHNSHGSGALWSQTGQKNSSSKIMRLYKWYYLKAVTALSQNTKLISKGNEWGKLQEDIKGKAINIHPDLSHSCWGIMLPWHKTIMIIFFIYN